MSLETQSSSVIQAEKSGRQQPSCYEQEQAARQRAAELERINRLLRESSQALARARTPQDIFEIFLVHAVNAMEATSGGLLKRIENTEHEFVALVRDGVVVPKTLWPEERIITESPDDTRRDSFGVIRSLMSGEDRWILVDDDFERWAPGTAEFHRRAGNQAMMLWPFQNADEVVGYIGIGFNHTNVPSQIQCETLKALSSQASLALELNTMTAEVERAATLREQEKAAQQRVAELAKTNEALKQTLDIVAFEPELNKVLGHILASITKQLESPSSALWLLDGVSGRFHAHLVCQEGRIIEFNRENKSFLSSLWGSGRDLAFKDHIHDRRPVVYQVEDFRFSNGAAFAFFRNLGVQSLLGIPLLLGSEIVGSLTVRFDVPRLLNPEELELTQAMAHQATMAIQLTRLAERAGEAALSEERTRFARDVHDTLAQGFTGILMQLGAASQVPGNTRSDIQPQLTAIDALARSSLAEARRSVRALRPSLASPECQLDRTVGQFVERVRLQTHAEVLLHIKGMRGRLAPQVENELCRIVQESLNNAVKHAKANRIHVTVEFQNHDAVRIAVKDDGVGFDPALRPAADSFGLIGMQERASSIGASLTIISEEGCGAEIVAQYQPRRS